MTATLLIRLVGPMQSWGTRSKFDDRDSEIEPSKSGVLGLCAAALGIDRQDPIDHLAALRFGVRVDKEGAVRTDYHTAQLWQGLPERDQQAYIESLPPDLWRGRDKHPRQLSQDTSQSWRVYLADAAFWAALEGERGELEKIEAALHNPHWPLCLGRKSFVPSQPVWLGGGVQDGALLDVLRAAPSLRGRRDDQHAPYRYVIEKAESQAVPSHFSPGMRRDQPVAPFAQRRFAQRDVWMFTEAVALSEVG